MKTMDEPTRNIVLNLLDRLDALEEPYTSIGDHVTICEDRPVQENGDDGSERRINEVKYSDWLVTATLKRAELDELIHRLNEYREEKQAKCIISASNQKEAVSIGFKQFSMYMDIPRSCIRAAKARKLPT